MLHVVLRTQVLDAVMQVSGSALRQVDVGIFLVPFFLSIVVGVTVDTANWRGHWWRQERNIINRHCPLRHTHSPSVCHLSVIVVTSGVV